MSDDAILRAVGVSKRFGAFSAVTDVDYVLREGEVAGIIGPNGAGKSTFFNLMTGLYAPTQGRIEFRGRDVTRLDAHQRVALGIVRTFQLVSVFGSLSVIENLILSVLRFREGAMKPWRFLFAKAHSVEVEDACLAALQRVGIAHLASAPTSTLSYGDKRRLEIAMSLSLNPRVLLLDEPLAGLGDGEITEVLELVREVCKSVTLVIIEHKISRIVDLVGRLSVMCEGRLLADGDPRRVLEDPEVRRVYWGDKAVAAAS